MAKLKIDKLTQSEETKKYTITMKGEITTETFAGPVTRNKSFYMNAVDNPTVEVGEEVNIPLNEFDIVKQALVTDDGEVIMLDFLVPKIN